MRKSFLVKRLKAAPLDFPTAAPVDPSGLNVYVLAKKMETRLSSICNATLIIGHERMNTLAAPLAGLLLLLTVNTCYTP
jgi:hypothetical protein